MDHELLKLLPDSASVVAVIAVVMIFLKYQREFNNDLRQIAESFTKQVDTIKNDFAAQVNRLSEAYLANERGYQTQIQNLFNDFISISKETITAVKELEMSVRELRATLHGDDEGRSGRLKH